MTDSAKSDPSERFADRQDAGRQLADVLEPILGSDDTVVLALPRGGVPVAYEVASRIGVPMDVLLVRKLGVPWQPEMAFGAVATGDIVVTNEDALRGLGLRPEVIKDAIDRETVELERRERLYHEGRDPVDITGKVVVVVDDGIATGSTVRAALKSLEQRGVERRIVACPVAAAETVRGLEEEADEVVCLRTPVAFGAVGSWYDDFAPVFDSEVKELLARADAESAKPLG